MWQLIKLGFRYGFMIIWNTLFKLKKYARNVEKYPLEVRFNAVKKIIKKVVDRWGSDYHIEGLDYYNKSNEKFLVLCNHISVIDPLIIIANVDRPIMVVAKQEVKKYPFIRTFFDALGGLYLDREHPLNQMRTLNEAMKIASDPNGPNVLIFPEGTRNKAPGGDCLEFHPGTFKIAMKSNVSVLPISIYGTQRFLNFKTNLKKYPIQVKFHKPISFDEYKEKTSYTLSDDVYKLINDQVQAFRINDQKFINEIKMNDKTRNACLIDDEVIVKYLTF